MTIPDPASMSHEERIDFIESMQQRVLQADRLRSEGASAEADAAEPSPAELNAAVNALRLIRKARSGGAKRKAPAKDKTPQLSMADLMRPVQ